MALVTRPQSSRQLVLSTKKSQPKNTKAVLEKSLAEVVDSSFHPEDRKRLVMSLKRRELDHQAQLEDLRNQLGEEQANTVAEVEAKLRKAEEAHYNVLGQFEAYKKLNANEMARLKVEMEPKLFHTSDL